MALCVALWTTSAKAGMITLATLELTIDGRTMSKDVKSMVTTQPGDTPLINFSQLFGSFIPSWATGEFFINDIESSEEFTLTKGIHLGVRPDIRDGVLTPHSASAHLVVMGTWNPDPLAPLVEESMLVMGFAASTGAGIACGDSKQIMTPFLDELDTPGFGPNCTNQVLGDLPFFGFVGRTDNNPLMVKITDDIKVKAEITDERALDPPSADVEFLRTLVEHGQVVPEPRTVALVLMGLLAAILARSRSLF